MMHSFIIDLSQVTYNLIIKMIFRFDKCLSTYHITETFFITYIFFKDDPSAFPFRGHGFICSGRFVSRWFYSAALSHTLHHLVSGGIVICIPTPIFTSNYFSGRLNFHPYSGTTDLLQTTRVAQNFLLRTLSPHSGNCSFACKTYWTHPKWHLDTVDKPAPIQKRF